MAHGEAWQRTDLCRGPRQFSDCQDNQQTLCQYPLNNKSLFLGKVFALELLAPYHFSGLPMNRDAVFSQGNSNVEKGARAIVRLLVALHL